MRRALDIISIEMSLSLSLSARTTVLAPDPGPRLKQLCYLFNLQMTVSPNAILPSIKSGGHEYTKGKRGGSATSRSFARPNYKARSLSPALSLYVVCFDFKGYGHVRL